MPANFPKKKFTEAWMDKWEAEEKARADDEAEDSAPKEGSSQVVTQKL